LHYPPQAALHNAFEANFSPGLPSAHKPPPQTPQTPHSLSDATPVPVWRGDRAAAATTSSTARHSDPTDSLSEGGEDEGDEAVQLSSSLSATPPRAAAAAASHRPPKSPRTLAADAALQQMERMEAAVASHTRASFDELHAELHAEADAKSSLGDAKSSLGDATSSLGDARSSLGDAKSSPYHELHAELYAEGLGGGAGDAPHEESEADAQDAAAEMVSYLSLAHELGVATHAAAHPTPPAAAVALTVVPGAAASSLQRATQPPRTPQVGSSSGSTRASVGVVQAVSSPLVRAMHALSMAQPQRPPPSSLAPAASSTAATTAATTTTAAAAAARTVAARLSARLSASALDASASLIDTSADTSEVSLSLGASDTLSGMEEEEEQATAGLDWHDADADGEPVGTYDALPAEADTPLLHAVLLRGSTESGGQRRLGVDDTLPTDRGTLPTEAAAATAAMKQQLRSVEVMVSRLGALVSVTPSEAAAEQHALRSQQQHLHEVWQLAAQLQELVGAPRIDQWERALSAGADGGSDDDDDGDDSGEGEGGGAMLWTLLEVARLSRRLAATAPHGGAAALTVDSVATPLDRTVVLAGELAKLLQLPVPVRPAPTETWSSVGSLRTSIPTTHNVAFSDGASSAAAAAEEAEAAVTASMLDVEHLAAQLSQLVGTASHQQGAEGDGALAAAAALPRGLAAAAAAAAAGSVTGTSHSNASRAAEATLYATLDGVGRLADDLSALLPFPRRASSQAAHASVVAAAEAEEAEGSWGHTSWRSGESATSTGANAAAQVELVLCSEGDDLVSELASESDLGSLPASSSTGGRGSGSGSSHRVTSNTANSQPSGSGSSHRVTSNTADSRPSGSSGSDTRPSPAVSVASAATVSTSSSVSYHLQPQKRSPSAFQPPYDAAEGDVLAWASPQVTHDGADRGLAESMLWEESSIGSDVPDNVSVVCAAAAASESEEPVSFIERYMQKRKAGATEVEAYHQASQEEAAAMRTGGGGGGGEAHSLSAEWRSVMSDVHGGSEDDAAVDGGTPLRAPPAGAMQRLSPPAGVRTDMDRFMAKYMEERTNGLDEEAAYEAAAAQAAPYEADEAEELPVVAVVPGLASLSLTPASVKRMQAFKRRSEARASAVKEARASSSAGGAGQGGGVVAARLSLAAKRRARALASPPPPPSSSTAASARKPPSRAASKPTHAETSRSASSKPKPRR
jgi:hypothetical protein